MKNKQHDWKFILQFLLAMVTFLFAVVRIGMFYWEYSKGAKEYQNLQDAVIFSEEESLTDTESDEFAIDFEKLQKINPDIVGWIQIEKLGISYPIVQGKDNEYYLSHTFYRKENKCGSIFMEVQNEKDFQDQNTFLYGHNMKDHSMFAKLNELKQEEVFQDNPKFLIYTPEGIHRYQIFSCYVASLESDSFQYKFTSEEEYARWQKNVKGYSIYDTGVEPQKEQKIVTLMTCTAQGQNYRFLVHGVLVN